MRYKRFLITSAELGEHEGIMSGTLRTVRIVQWAMLVSILLYAVVGEVVGSRARAPDPALNYIFSTLAIAIVGVIFVVRRTLVLRSAAALATNPEDALTLSHWRSGYIVTYALCEALALFGLVLRFTGFKFEQSVPFYLGGFVMLFFFGPREPARA